MKAEDFAAWLSAISGMNEGQRTEAIAALEKASAVGAEGGGSAKKAGSAAGGRTGGGARNRPASSASPLRLSPLREPRGRQLGHQVTFFCKALRRWERVAALSSAARVGIGSTLTV
jgi:hypothetical protein